MKNLRMKLLPMHNNDKIKSIFDPLTYAFIYPRPPEEPFVVKGAKREVENWILFNAWYPAIIHYVTETIKGTKNCYCSLINMGNLRIRRQLPNRFTWNRRFYYIVDVKGNQLLPIMELRKIPRCWIKELDPYIPSLILQRIKWKHKEKKPQHLLNPLADEELTLDFGTWIEP